MLLIVGLGNPGLEYSNTRHNIGFMIIDKLLSVYSNFSERHQFLSLTYRGVIGETKVILMKPQTYVNLSGSAVTQCMQFFKIVPNDLIVMHDDLDLQFSQVKIKCGGSSAGHNGLESIDSTIGKDYHRLRVGIGRPTNNISVSSFVVGKFMDNELTQITSLIKSIVENFNLLLMRNQVAHSSFISLLDHDRDMRF